MTGGPAQLVGDQARVGTRSWEGPEVGAPSGTSIDLDTVVDPVLWARADVRAPLVADAGFHATLEPRPGDGAAGDWRAFTLPLPRSSSLAGLASMRVTARGQLVGVWQLAGRSGGPPSASPDALGTEEAEASAACVEHAIGAHARRWHGWAGRLYDTIEEWRSLGSRPGQETWSELAAAWSPVESLAVCPRALIVDLARRLPRWLAQVARAPRTRLGRSHGLVPVGQAEELDDRCLRWLARQPGDSLPAKLGASRLMLAVRREPHVDTLENRVAATVARACRARAREYLDANRPLAGADPEGRMALVRTFGGLCGELLRSAPWGSVADAGPVEVPNYALSENLAYSAIWKAYVRLRRRATDEEDLWSWHHALWADVAAVLVVVSLLRELGLEELATTPPGFHVHPLGGRVLRRERLPGPLLYRHGTGAPLRVDLFGAGEVPPDLDEMLGRHAARPNLAIRVLHGDGPRWLCVWSAIDRRDDESGSFSGAVATSLERLRDRLAGHSMITGLLLCGAPRALDQWGDWGEPLVAVTVPFVPAGIDLFLEAIRRCAGHVFDPGTPGARRTSGSLDRRASSEVEVPVGRDRDGRALVAGADIGAAIVQLAGSDGNVRCEPALGISRARGEHLLVGRSAARDREASGFDAPPDARRPVAHAEPPARLRAADAWARLRQGGQAWRVQTGEGAAALRGARLAPATVLAALAATEPRDQLAVSIPNSLEEQGQALLLHALRRHVRQPLLIWRPVAAAICALARARCPFDSLVCLDLGGPWPEWTELSLRDVEGMVLPVRSRPVDAADAAVAPSQIEDELVVRLLQAKGVEFDDATRWHASRGRGWIADAVWGAVQGVSAHFVVPVPDRSDQRLADLPLEPGTLDRQLDELLAEQPQGASQPMRWYSWIGAQARAWPARGRRRGSRSTLLAVGWPAALPGVANRIAEIVAREAPRLDVRWQDRFALVERARMVAVGAAHYATLRRQGRPTYLDTLPHFALQVRAGLKVTYRDLTPPGQVVPAEGMFERVVEDLFAERGKPRLLLRVRREDEAKPREVEFWFPVSPSDDVPLRLSVQVRPASGHAHLWVEPADGSLVFGVGRVSARWRDMTISDDDDPSRGVTYPDAIPGGVRLEGRDLGPRVEALGGEFVRLQRRLRRDCHRPARTDEQSWSWVKASFGNLGRATALVTHFGVAELLVQAADLLQSQPDAARLLPAPQAWAIGEVVTLFLACAASGIPENREVRKEAVRAILFLLRARQRNQEFLAPDSDAGRTLLDVLAQRETEELRVKEIAGRTLTSLAAEFIRGEMPGCDLPVVMRDLLQRRPPR